MSSKNGKKKDTQTVSPKLRFPAFRDTQPWKEKGIHNFLTESCVLGSGGDRARKITVKLWGKGVHEKSEALKGSANTQYYKRSKGQFIYSKLDFLNGAFGIIPEHLDGFESTVDLPCFDLSEGLNANFLLEYVKREAFYKTFGEIADGGRKAKRIHAETFLSFPLALPPTLEEQQKIADCLISLDELIVAHQQKFETLKNYRKGLMQQLFPRANETLPLLRFPEFQGDVEWKCDTLQGIAEISSGSTPLRSNAEFYADGIIPWVKTTDLNNSFIEETEEKISSKARARINPVGSVLVAMYGGFNQIGRTGCLSVPAATNQAISVLVINPEVAIPAYVLAWLNARVDDWKRIASSSRKDPNITGTDVAKFCITYPRIPEQQRIADCLTLLDSLISAQSRKVETLAIHKKGLLQQLFPSLDEREK